MENAEKAETLTFEAEFQRRVTSIKDRALASGISIAFLCRENGVSRSTPDRWSVRAPKTIMLIDALESTLAAEEQKIAAEKQTDNTTE